MPRAKSFEDEIAYYQARRERVIAEVARAFLQSAAVHARWGGKHPRDEMWILSQDTHPVEEGAERPWRISRFGKDGPFGHDVRNGRDEVIALAASEWSPSSVVPMTEDEVIAWTSTAQYAEGVKQVAFMQAINSLSWHTSKAGARHVEQMRAAYNEAWKLAHDGHIEEATDLAVRAVRRQSNPAPEFVPNPAWVTKAVAENWDKITAEMGIAWLPKFGQVRAARGRISASMKELGCGAFGCVLPTVDPSIVLKVTTDQTEMDFVVKILPDLPAMITTKYFAWTWTKSTRKARRIGMLWRESADFVGKIHQNIPDGLEALKAIRAQHEAASQCLLTIIRDQYGALPGMLAVWQALTDRMSRIPELAFVARGMLAAYEQQGVFFADVHEGNLGRVMRDGRYQWVITDPGNVVVIGDEASADEYEDKPDPAELADLRRIFNVNPVRNLRIGVVGYSAQAFDEAKARRALRDLFDRAAGERRDVTVVSGLTDLGIPGLAYRIAVLRGWKTAGVACSKATDYKCYPVDEQTLVGTQWGDESSTFLDSIDVLVRVGGGKQSHAEARAFASRGGTVLEYDLPATP